MPIGQKLFGQKLFDQKVFGQKPRNQKRKKDRLKEANSLSSEIFNKEKHIYIQTLPEGGRVDGERGE
jgi:hypothetical protein